MSCKNKCLWWKKRTRTETCLYVAITFSIIVIVYLSTNLRKNSISGDGNQQSICMTEKCIRSAATILERIDKNVNPCDNFYKFACGNFLEHVFVPVDKKSVNSFSLVSDKVKIQLKTLVDDPPQQDDPEALKLLKTVYISCMNTTKIEKEGLSFVKKAFKELGGWPVVDSNWNEKKFDWKNLLYRLRRTGWRPTMFVKMIIDSDLKNSSKWILTITQPDVAYYLSKKGFDDTDVQAYYDYVVNIATFFGASTLAASVEMKEVVHFEANLAKITIPYIERTNTTLEYNPMTIKELQKIIPTIPWLQLINNYLAPIDMLTSKDVINVALPKYLEKLEDLLLNTKKRILANYMFIKIVRDSMNHLPEKLRNLELDYLRIIEGKTRMDPRWKQCVRELDKLHIAASSVYLKKFFKKSDKKKVTDLALDVKGAFLETLRKLEWMDQKTRKHAVLKAEKMNTFIAYPDELLDDNKVEEYYKGLELNSDDYYLKMSFSLSGFSHMKRIKKLRQGVITSDWTTLSYSYYVNAFYDQRDNAIELYAGIMQENFFDSERPQYMNYGSIGEVIGHEITHGFDDHGGQYDEKGNLVDWWEPKTRQIFAQRTQCLVEQYNNMTVPEIGLKLDGFKNLGENIADNGGIKMAYKGYVKWLERNKAEPALPGLPYTKRQMFWISAAINGCTKYKKESLKQLVLSGHHAPDYFRVMVPFMNSEYFGNDFNCSVGSPMNPQDKCQVW